MIKRLVPALSSLFPALARQQPAEAQESALLERLATLERENNRLGASLQDLEGRCARLQSQSDDLLHDNVRLRHKIGEVLQHRVDAWSASVAGPELTPEDVSAFIKAMDDKFEGHLSSVLNYSRVVSLAYFARSVKRLGLASQAHVGVISGSLREWELLFVSPQKVTTIEFDREPANNLDMSWSDSPSKNFSLTICNQVLEHVFNPHVAFRNLVHHTAADGYIYVSIPTINCIHGEPNYYSSGFHPRFLEKLAEENRIELVEVGYWGSYKYMINAVSGYWLSAEQMLPGSTEGVLFPELVAADGRIRNDRFMTDCWGLFRKVGQSG